jgi:hypothetical protein
MRGTLFLLAMALIGGCSRERAGNASASAYTSDSDSSARENGFAGTNSGPDLEAPRLLPAIQNQLNLMAKGGQPATTDNLTAYKNMAGDLINSMIADVYRAGYADSGRFRALSDSVLNDLGGGAGTEATLDRSKLPQHIQRMRHLLALYQQAIKNVPRKAP